MTKSTTTTSNPQHESSDGTTPPDGEVVREVHLKISPQYATISVVPKEDGEKNDKNFPRNLHNAAELFLRVGMVNSAEKLKQCADMMIGLYSENPDGKSGVRLGKACVCWSCGYCGLPKDFQEDHGNNGMKKKNTPPGPCFSCNEINQVNWIRVTQKQGKKITEMPWIEIAPLTEEEVQKKKEAELAAKRAEVEAKVQKALEERSTGADDYDDDADAEKAEI
jgi:hypothetical protein